MMWHVLTSKCAASQSHDHWLGDTRSGLLKKLLRSSGCVTSAFLRGEVQNFVTCSLLAVRNTVKSLNGTQKNLVGCLRNI
jgi:hypothetical protein